MMRRRARRKCSGLWTCLGSYLIGGLAHSRISMKFKFTGARIRWYSHYAPAGQPADTCQAQSTIQNGGVI